MNRWLKRLVYLLLLLVWLIVMAFPTFAFLLAARGELQLGDESRSHLRFFMVQEAASSGVGVEWVREASRVDNCTRTTLRYFLWESDETNQNVSFCQCYDPVSNAPLPVAESSCTP